MAATSRSKNVLQRIADHISLDLSPEDLETDDPAAHFRRVLDDGLQPVDPAVSLLDLDALVSRVVATFEPFDTGIDVDMAIPLHRALPISRRVAADRRMWMYLSLVSYPEFVCHRFKAKMGHDGRMRRPKERFLGNPVRNAFARLWWACELTCDGGDYSYTRKMLEVSGFQDNYEAYFGRAFSQYRPAMWAAINVLSGNSEATVRETTKSLGRVLTTLVLESQDQAALEELLRRIMVVP